MQISLTATFTTLCMLASNSSAAAIAPRNDFEDVVKYSCSEDLAAFEPTKGKFVVHYTSTRDSAITEPWVRVCYPRDSGDDWHQSKVLLSPCSKEKEVSFSPQRMEVGGSESLVVANGEGGCDDDPKFGDLEGAYLKYNGLKIDLMNGGRHCGPRDRGISCEFVLKD